jgi:hypothetical protein
MTRPIKYHLSNGQKKDLLLQGRRVTIALPVPPHEIDDPIDWARSVLDEDIAERVTHAVEDEVWCLAPSVTNRSDATLSSHWGRVVIDPDRKLCLRVVAVVVTLTPRNCRGTRPGISWPSHLTFLGEVYPARIDHAEKTQSH